MTQFRLPFAFITSPVPAGNEGRGVVEAVVQQVFVQVRSRAAALRLTPVAGS